MTQAEQVRSVSVERVGRQVGLLPSELLEQLNAALRAAPRAVMIQTSGERVPRSHESKSTWNGMKMALMRKLTVLAGMAEAARRYARNNPDKISKLADKAGRFVDKRTNGKYHRKIDSAVRKVRTSVGHSGSRGSWPHR